MNTLDAFLMGELNRGKEEMCFDWDLAAKKINASGCRNAYAGLRGDWEYTGGKILSNGIPVTYDYTYLASTWAVPELELDGRTEPCYRMASKTPGWNAKTKWPQSALDILNSSEGAGATK